MQRKGKLLVSGPEDWSFRFYVPPTAVCDITQSQMVQTAAVIVWLWDIISSEAQNLYFKMYSSVTL